MTTDFLIGALAVFALIGLCVGMYALGSLIDR